jgi:hypothetical protein
MSSAQPLYPLVSVYKDKGLNIVRDASNLSKASVLILLKLNPEECIYYDACGKRWVCLFSSAEFKILSSQGFWQILFTTPYILLYKTGYQKVLIR